MAYAPGPFSHEHGYLQWGGTLPGGEIWSCGLRMAALGSIIGGTFPLNGGDIETYLDKYVIDIKAFHQRATTAIGPRALLNFVKLNKIGLDGHYVDSDTHVRFFANVAGGGVTSNVHPNQVALAVSLTTDVDRGPASKGRIYLPLPALLVETDGLISIANITPIVASWRTFLEALSDAPGLDNGETPEVVVMSRKAGAPAARTVTGVRIGRVLDTQRRRRNALKENYVGDVVDFGLF